MINIIKKSAAFLLSAVLCGSVFSLTAAAEDISYEDTPVDPVDSYLTDEPDLLTVEEENELLERIYETAAYIDMNIGIWVSDEHVPESDTQMYCEWLCDNSFGLDEDSIILYMDLSGHDDPYYSPYDYFYTRNRARFYYSGNTDVSDGGRISTIFSAMNPYLPRTEEDIYSAVGVFLDELEMFYDYGPDPAVEYFYVPDTDKYVTLESDGTLVHSDSRPKNWGKALLIGIVIGLIAALIVFIGVKLHYRFKSKPSSLQYMSFEQAQFGPRSDVFIRKYQIRRKRESSSSGGRSGGGGGTRSGGGGGGNRR